MSRAQLPIHASYRHHGTSVTRRDRHAWRQESKADFYFSFLPFSAILFSFAHACSTSAHVSITWDVYVRASRRLSWRTSSLPAGEFFSKRVEGHDDTIYRSSNRPDYRLPGSNDKRWAYVRCLGPFPGTSSVTVRSSASIVNVWPRRLRTSLAFLDIFYQSLHVQQWSLTTTGNCLACSTLIVPALTRHGFLRFEFARACIVYMRDVWAVKIGLEERSN